MIIMTLVQVKTAMALTWFRAPSQLFGRVFLPCIHQGGAK
jgi:hypothetical protein